MGALIVVGLGVLSWLIYLAIIMRVVDALESMADSFASIARSLEVVALAQERRER
jgi:hypothetical protein